MSDLDPGTQIWVTSNTMFHYKIPLLKGERLIAHFSVVVVMLGLYSNRMKTLLSQARSNALVEASSGHGAGALCHRPRMSSDNRFRLWVGASLGVCDFLGHTGRGATEGLKVAPNDFDCQVYLSRSPQSANQTVEHLTQCDFVWEIQSTLLWIRTCRQKTIIQSMLKKFHFKWTIYSLWRIITWN